MRLLTTLPGILSLVVLSLIPPSARCSYLLLAHFISYENTLHSFVNTSSFPYQPQCCDGQVFTNCTGPCNTNLNYCFKKVGSVNNFTDDSIILSDCIEMTRSLTELREPQDNIDFTNPPYTVSGIQTWSSIANRDEIWTGGIQFFIRSIANGEIVDYLSIDIYLNPGETLSNQMLIGNYFGENVTFITNFSLACTFNFYGENCSILCIPGNNTEDGFYTCNNDGGRICNDHFNGSGCKECADGYAGELCEQDLDMCSHVGPCVEGNCTNTGPESYMCQCSEGFSGANCTDADKDTIPDVGTTFTLVTVSGVAGVLAPLCILSPLIIILCFTALGTWKKKNNKKDYVPNPLYTPVPPPSSATNTMESDRQVSAELSVIVESGDETPTPCAHPLGEEQYSIIPGDPQASGDHELHSQVAPSNENNSQNFSFNETGSPYYNSYASYDVPPPALPERNNYPLSLGSSFRSNDGRSLDTTVLSDDTQINSYEPSLSDPDMYCDIVRDRNGALSIQLPLNIALPRNISIRRSRSNRSRVWRPRVHQPIDHTLKNSFRSEPIHKPLTKSTSFGTPPSSHCHQNHSFNRMDFAHYTNEHDLPPVPSHGRFSIFGSDIEKRLASTLGSEPSTNFSGSFTDHSQSTLFPYDPQHSISQTTVVGETNSHPQSIGNTADDAIITIQYNGLSNESADEPTSGNNPHYDKVPEEKEEEGVYNHLANHDKSSYAPYDVPKKHTSEI